MLSLLFVLSCFFDDNEGQPWTTLFGIRRKCCLCCLCCRVFLTTTMDNLGQHFWNKKEMLSLLFVLS